MRDWCDANRLLLSVRIFYKTGNQLKQMVGEFQEKEETESDHSVDLRDDRDIFSENYHGRP
ncbi:hypothetical protein MA16_Dca018465 [Dendrobium catenatum]|uniref:Uncharacterized protein n=1 Tax=Dendrobium catenatum TaxID=906689 RepID=A0A2I0X7F2_9ASPA|nr:hypothetical protein MA16_Dca018465 [Dendrobium catenatum]